MDENEGDADIIIVGAGLAGGILAWFLKLRAPELRIFLLEQAAEISKNKTWSFHRSDLCEDDYQALLPLVAKTWDGYSVKFRHLSRTLSTGYNSIRPEHFEAQLKALLAGDLKFNTKIRTVDSNYVELESGEKVRAGAVIDARGMNPSKLSDSGFQKFVGLNVEFENPHGLKQPILMDATVSQTNGFRFIYVLPWSPTEALIEDTYYGDATPLDPEFCMSEIRKYAEANGWTIRSVVSRETGCLPIPLWRPVRRKPKAPEIGVSGGFFHAVTGYSVPDAVAVARGISELSSRDVISVLNFLDRYSAGQTKSWSFFCLLNRMLFRAAAPQERFRIFERFYKFRQPLIERFYASQLTWLDRIQLLSGRPPVPVLSAVKSAFAHPTPSQPQEALA